MFCRFDRLTTGSSLLLLLVALGANGVVGDNAKIIPIASTPLPAAAAAHAAAKLPPAPVTGKPDAAAALPKHVDTAKIVTKPPVPAAPGPITTIKPAAANVKPITNAPIAAAAPHANAVHAATTAPVAAVAPAAGAADFGPGKKLAQYFEPICAHLDKLTNEHMFKLQAQLKSFIEKTAGKMSVCFMQHYMMDPNLTPVDRAQLKTICSSQTLAPDNKNSFKNFQTCSANNWDKNLDTELDRIIKLRLNCFYNHAHSKHDSTISLVHESDELSIIGEVVGKVLSDSKLAGNNNSNITMINLAVPPAGKPAGPPANNNVAPNNKAAPSVAPNNQAAANNKLLNDPNTVLVIVNDTPTTGPAAAAKANAPAAPGAAHPPAPPPPAPPAGPAQLAPLLTTKAPAIPVVAAPASTLKPAPPAAAPSVAPAAAAGPLVTVKPVATVKPAAAVNPAVTVKPAAAATLAVTVKPAATALGEKIIAAVTTAAPKPPATTGIPKANVSLTTLSTGLKLAAGLAQTTAKSAVVKLTPAASTAKPLASTMKPGGTTSKPAAGPTTGKPALTGAPATSQKPPAAGTTKAAASTSKPQTTPAAGSTAAPEKDKKEAKDAIKSLQAQRANHVSDARLHQLEHERQMAIDPEGHSDKHKKYEQMKQQRTSKAPGSTAAPASTAAPTTKKP